MLETTVDSLKILKILKNTSKGVHFVVKLQAEGLNLNKATLLKKETLAQVFSCEFCEISKNTSFTEHYWATASVKI